MHKVILALAVVAVMASSAVAGEVPQATLGDMGLASMRSMSDNEGMAIRGAFAVVGGFSFASTPGTASGHGYAAGDFGPGPDLAVGASFAQAQTNVTTTGLFGIPLGSVTVTAQARGGAFAFAGP